MTTPLMTTPAPPTFTPAQFIARWQDAGFGERQGAQSFFNDLCALVGHPTPAAYGEPEVFTFEKAVPGGFADAYFEEHFGWEFKGRDAQLEGAFDQLLRYQVHLKTPPLLVVSSFDTIRIQTNFQNMETARYEIPVAELEQHDRMQLLRDAFFAPGRFRERLRSVDEVTRATAALFQAIVEYMEQGSAAGAPPDPERLARYLNQLVFCLYAEDAGLLPEGLFTRIVAQNYRAPAHFDGAVRSLFAQMAAGGFAGADPIARFNGDLFQAGDTVPLNSAALQKLGEACASNWRNIEPSIFGTLFERALDAAKRTLLGAHYTGAEDIMLVVEPVVMQPLRREWDAARREIDDLRADDDHSGAYARLEDFRQRLASVTVLDPACGSGNFLYLALRSLLDLEKQAIDYAAAQGWHGLTPTVKPNQMLGLELEHYAAELARTALWIGYIQWHQSNGFPYTQDPILTPLDTIRQTDAILDWSDADNPAEPEWPAAEFIVGNPPFLGRGGLRSGLGDDYTDSIYSVYAGRLPNASDLCCYWFEKARAQIADGNAKRAGLLATQGIRGRDNRAVLQSIKTSGDIFMAYPDKEWVLDGAAVRIAIVGFDDGSDAERYLDGNPVAGGINSNLTIGVDTTTAQRLAENGGISFEGPSPKASFDISPELAEQFLSQPLNVNGRPNSDVVRPVLNARDLVQRSRGMYTIDFAMMGENEASQYEMPFEHIRQHVWPKRQERSQAPFRHRWWQYATPRPNMRQALAGLTRYIATPRVSKHRIFVWVDSNIMCNDSTDVFARDDDYTFGVLHSRIHEIWALDKGTQLESRPRYTPTTCFETFPFPQPTDEQRAAIAAAAVELNRLRENWLNPLDGEGGPALNAADLRRRTLTSLYNQRPTWLDNAHKALDAAVADAYGWSAADVDVGDGAILAGLLALNLGRAEGG